MSLIEQTVGIFTTDANLVIRSWDSWLVNRLGIPAEKALGKRIVALFPDLETRGMIVRFERVLTKGVVEVLAPTFHHYLLACPPSQASKRFEKMQQHVTIAPLREQETVVGTIVTIEDVTTRLDRERDLNEQLQSPDEVVRLRAALVLSEEGEQSSAQPLIGSLGDESWRVRKAATEGLARKAGAEEVNILLRALRDEHRNPGVLNSALQVLALGGIDAIAPLAEFLSDPDEDLRIYATLALGDQHDPRAIAPLIGALDDPNVNVRFHAIESLGKLRAWEAADALAAIAESKDFFLAFPALYALTLINDARIAPRLVALLEDELLRSPATEALGALGDDDVIAPLTALLNTQGAPAPVIAQALTTLYDRYQKEYREGEHIADLARQSITREGAQNLVDAVNHAASDQLGAIALVLGWLEGEAVERSLVRLLGQPTARKEVVEALVRYGGRATELLIEQLNNEEIETRKAVVTALGRIGDARATTALVEALENDRELIVPVAGALGKIGDRRAFDALLGLIGDRDAAVRQSAIAAINSLGHPDMAGRALELLNDTSPHVRESAVKIAGYFGYEQCADLLFERCNDGEESVRRAAIEHLPYLEDDRVIATLVDAIENGTPRVRAAAASSFAQVDAGEAMPYLQAALGDEDSWVRYFATRSIGRHKHTESLDRVAQLAEEDPAEHVRIAAVDSLGKIGGPRAVSVLSALVESPDMDMAGAALSSLGQINHPDALPPLFEALRSPQSARRVAALQALGARGGEGTVEALQWVAAADSDSAVAQAAIDALSRLGTPEAVSALVNLTADKARRESSIEALSRLGKQKIELIAKGFDNAQSSVRRALADALGRMKHPHASELLSNALDDEEASVRLAAINALAHLGSRSAQRKLVEMMRLDPEPGVRRAAQKALSR